MTRRVHNQVATGRPQEQALLQAIVSNPAEEGLWLILADWLDENDDPRRAELLRLHRQLIATCCEPDLHPERAQQQARIVQLLTEGVRPCVPRQTLTLGKGVDMAFAWIPPGSFLMGSPERQEGRQDDETQHRVTLTQGFWLALTPVTQRQWQEVMGDNPAHFKGKDLPVDIVSWSDCQDFCRRLGERKGKSCQLPTEAQWERACRAGATTPFFFGEMISTEQANYDGSFPYAEGAKGVYRRKATAVGSFPPNAWCLFDLHGNVWEWCQDWYARYGKEAMQDPAGPATGTYRVVRGGCWYGYARVCRAAHRLRSTPGSRRNSVGFRPAICLD